MLEGSEGTAFAGWLVYPMIVCGYFYVAHVDSGRSYLILQSDFFFPTLFAKVGITMEKSSSLQSIPTNLLESRMHFLAVLTFSKCMIENTALYNIKLQFSSM